jgi:hypothetical protein
LEEFEGVDGVEEGEGVKEVLEFAEVVETVGYGPQVVAVCQSKL